MKIATVAPIGFGGVRRTRASSRTPGWRAWRLVALAMLAASGQARAQSQARPYLLEDAVSDALANHPRIAASRADERAAEARLTEARTHLLPSAGISAEINRSSGNTPPGAFFPAAGFIPISGAPRGKTLDSGFWQTGAAVWATWDVLSLARQAAAVDVALAGRSESQAATNAQRLEVAYRAADAFLLVLEAQETVRAATANVDRAQVLVTMTKPLVDQNLRPGVDLARAQAELANARTQLARAEQLRDVRRAQLAEAIGKTELPVVDIAPGALTETPTEGAPPSPLSRVADHPSVVQATAAAGRVAETRRQVAVEYLPRLDLVASLWARGSGLFNSPASGLVPDISNWCAGAVATWSILDIPTVRARARVAQANYEAAIARRDDVVLAVSGQVATASATLEGARQIARQTPFALTSAHTAEQQATARYKAGLSPVVDLADALRVLAQAEIDDAVARLEVRRAELLLSRATGDLGPFLSRARGG